MQNKKGITRRETLVAGLAGAFALTSGGVNAAGQTKLTLWTVRQNTPELAAAMKGILDAFTKENPDIVVTQEPVSGAAVYPKFQAALQGQQMPDVAEAYTYHPLQFAALDQMEPMDDIIDEWKKNGQYDQLYNKFAVEKDFWKGHYWAAAYNMDIRPFYYRRDLFEAKKIAPPKTWDEFQAAAIALNDPAKGTFGLVFPAGDFHIAQHFYAGFMFQAGGSILDKDSKLVFGTTAKAANVKALQFLTDFATKHKVTPPGIAAYNTEDPHTLFLQGRAAMCMGTGGLVGRIMRENPDMFEKVGILEALEGPAGKDRKLVAGFYQGFFVWKYSPAKDAAKKFIRWITQPNRLEPSYKASPGSLWPIYKSGLEADRVKTNRLLREALANVAAFTTDFAFPGTPVPEMGIVDGEKLFAAPVNQVVSGAKTVEQAVDDAHKAMVKVFSS
jgi:ABC-type glycerol-3-phosphate transport system substrate-binding protein